MQPLPLSLHLQQITTEWRVLHSCLTHKLNHIRGKELNVYSKWVIYSHQGAKCWSFVSLVFLF